MTTFLIDTLSKVSGISKLQISKWVSQNTCHTLQVQKKSSIRGFALADLDDSANIFDVAPYDLVPAGLDKPLLKLPGYQAFVIHKQVLKDAEVYGVPISLQLRGETDLEPDDNDSSGYGIFPSAGNWYYGYDSSKQSLTFIEDIQAALDSVIASIVTRNPSVQELETFYRSALMNGARNIRHGLGHYSQAAFLSELLWRHGAPTHPLNPDMNAQNAVSYVNDKLRSRLNTNGSAYVHKMDNIDEVVKFFPLSD